MASSGDDTQAEWFCEAFADVFELDPETTSLQSTLLEDLGFDSLMMYEVLLFVDELVPHEVPPEALDEMRTIADVAALWISYSPSGDRQERT